MNRIILYMMALLFILQTPSSPIAAEQEQQATAPKAAQENEQYEKSMQERLGKPGKQLDGLKARLQSILNVGRNRL